jgi:hypothetical protein
MVDRLVPSTEEINEAFAALAPLARHDDLEISRAALRARWVLMLMRDQRIKKPSEAA